MVLRSCVDSHSRKTIGLPWNRFYMHTMNCLLKFALHHNCNLSVQLTLMESKAKPLTSLFLFDTLSKDMYLYIVTNRTSMTCNTIL